MEQFDYNLETTKFKSILPRKIFLSRVNALSGLEKFANHWYIESSDDIILCKTTLHPFLSGSSHKIVYPDIYKFDFKTKNLTELFTINTIVDKSNRTGPYRWRNSYTSLSALGFTINGIHTTDTVSASYINIDNIDKPIGSYNDIDNTYSLNFVGRDSNYGTYIHNWYFNAGKHNEFEVDHLDLFKPNLDVFNYNLGSYFGKTVDASGTKEPAVSAWVEDQLARGVQVDPKPISYDSRTSVISISGRDDRKYEAAWVSNVSGRSINPSHTHDVLNETVRMGAGVSASRGGWYYGDIVSQDQPDTDISVYSHNASFLLFNHALSSAGDVVVCFDFAMYTNTSAHSAYAQIFK